MISSRRGHIFLVFAKVALQVFPSAVLVFSVVDSHFLVLVLPLKLKLLVPFSNEVVRD